MRFTHRKALLCGCAALCLSAAAARAQQAPAVAEQSPPAAAVQPTDTQPSDPRQDNGEIVVTAQRREQRLSEVPASVTALTGEQLSQSGVVDTHTFRRSRLGCNSRSTGLSPSRPSGALAQP